MQFRKTDLAVLFITGFFACNPDSDEVLAAGDDCETNSNLCNYLLSDINASSSTYGENISPSYYNNKITVHYFGHQN